MSRTNQVLELLCPEGKAGMEQLTGGVQECNCCRGSGWHWEKDALDEEIKIDCPVCKGAGKVRPVITIEWRPVCQDK